MLCKKISNIISENEYSKGALVGINQTLVGHPFDTIKVIQQNASNKNPFTLSKMINIFKKRPLVSSFSLYRGVSFSLTTSVYYNSLTFGMFEYFVGIHDLNWFQSGFISGTVTSVLLNPFEYYKVKYQSNAHHTEESLKHNYRFRIFKGLRFTMLRESIANAVYFSTYYNLKERNIDSFIAGGISGINSWLLTYPIDTIKTRYQAQHNPSLKKIILQGNFSKGLGFCIFRAFIVNGVSFTLYEKL